MSTRAFRPAAAALNDATFGIKPMLARAGEMPEGPDWTYEVKWDGIRALVRVDDHGVCIITRNGINVTARYPELQDVARDIPHVAKPLLLDGEIVAFDEKGMPVFARLQRRMNLSSTAEVAAVRQTTPAHLAVFDLPVMAGRQLTSLPWSDRRKLLERLDIAGAYSSVPATYEDGHALLEAMAERGMEGVIAKRRASLYRSGRRSDDWTKIKIRPRQEFVIGGWAPGSGRRALTFGSLLLGAYEKPGDSRLSYVGNVGSGFGDEELEAIFAALETLERSTSPFIGPVEPPSARFVTPHLVVEVEYAELTADHRLRHPVYKGLRADKAAEEVVFEGDSQ